MLAASAQVDWCVVCLVPQCRQRRRLSSATAAVPSPPQQFRHCLSSASVLPPPRFRNNRFHRHVLCFRHHLSSATFSVPPPPQFRRRFCSAAASFPQQLLQPHTFVSTPAHTSFLPPPFFCHSNNHATTSFCRSTRCTRCRRSVRRTLPLRLPLRLLIRLLLQCVPARLAVPIAASSFASQLWWLYRCVVTRLAAFLLPAASAATFHVHQSF